MNAWRLEVLGGSRLRNAEREIVPERKSAALLAYLALEGPTSRSRLAGLLWPESPEETARNNLSQTLRRIRRRTGAELIGGGDPLRLRPELAVDVAELEMQAFAEAFERVAEPTGELLDGLDFDDCPELGEWLEAEREDLRALRRQALATLVERAETNGRWAEALRHAERLLDLDPVAEGVHRTVMRLHHLLGDRPAALKAYHRCQRWLRRELDIDPLPETKALAREIERDAVPPGAPERPRPRALPGGVLRPPVLVGRGEAWERMEEAWARGQVIYITGEPGVGKTRLAQEFVAGKGRGLYLPARPGQQDVPYAAAAGLARIRLAAAPDAPLPGWVRLELSRILPELRAGGDPPPIARDEDRLRFLQAYTEMVALTGAGVLASIHDDVQYYDAATVDLGVFMSSQRHPLGSGENLPRTISIYRRGELPPGVRASVEQLVEAGVAARIELGPLDAGTTASLLRSLRLEQLEGADADALAEALHRRTGGNALFLLETLRGLLETDRLGRSVPERLPTTGRMTAVVRQRLARLSPAAQRTVQAAAVLQRDFDLDLIGRVLEVEPLDLIGAWEELEGAHIFHGDRFSHDLLYEAALDGIARPVRELLDRRSAEALAARDANPARIAKHWLAAGDELRAVPFLRSAAEKTAGEARLEDAAGFFAQIDDILARHGRAHERAEVDEARRRALARMPS